MDFKEAELILDGLVQLGVFEKVGDRVIMTSDFIRDVESAILNLLSNPDIYCSLGDGDITLRDVLAMAIALAVSKRAGCLDDDVLEKYVCMILAHLDIP